MKARPHDDALGSLEQALVCFYHTPEPEPEFIQRLEREILVLDSTASASTRARLNWRELIHQPAQVLIWGAAGLLLVVLLTWIFNNTIPQPVPVTHQLVTTISPRRSLTPSPSITTTPTPKITPTPREALFYTVNEGDTLLSISKESGVPIDVLAKLNYLTSEADLWVGRQLLLGFTGDEVLDPYLHTATPVTPAPSAKPLTHESSSDEIRQRLLASSNLWHTLWADALTTTSSKGEVYTEREQVWLSPPDKSRWLTGQIGSEPSLLWMTNAGSSTQINLQTGDILELEPGVLLPSQLNQLIFPTSFAVRGGTFRPINSEITAGRQAIVVDWTNNDGHLIDRFWVDTSTGVILRWRHFPVEYPDSSGKVIPSEIVITSVVFDVDLTASLFDPHAPPPQEFAPNYPNP